MKVDDPLNNIDFSKYLFTDITDSRVELDSQLLGDNHIIEEKSVVYADKFIFFTLNADKPHSRFEYNKVIKKVINIINEKSGLQMISQWYFEDRNRAGLPTRLHVHGMLSHVPVTYYPYEGLCKNISKTFHKYIGRKKVKHSVCADVQWARDNASVSDYCGKYNSAIFNGKKLLLPRL